MATKSKSKQPTAKQLRDEAKGLGIEGWEDMTKAELKEAVNTAKAAEELEEVEEKPKKKSTKKASSKKSTSKKKTAKKASSKKSSSKASTNGDNPFRPNTNLYFITEALKKGGKRKTLTKQLKSKLQFNPRKQSEDEFDVEAEIDRRLKVVGYILKNQHGWDYEHEGRGPEATIKVSPPS